MSTITSQSVFQHGLHESGRSRPGVPLTGSTSNVLRIFNGPVLVLAMFMEVTEAVENAVCNMKWRSGDRLIADNVNIQAAAPGDFFWAKLDAVTAVQKPTTATGLIHGAFNRSVIGATESGEGLILSEGGIDIVLSATPTTGKATLYVYYRPLVENAVIAPGEMT